MAEVLIMSVDNGHPTDVVKDTKRYHRGDVVCVQPDGWRWGTQELTNPMFRIIKLPNITVLQLQQFLAGEPETNPQQPSRTRWRRFYKASLDAATGQLRNYLTDATRAQPFFTSSFSFAQFDALRVQKAPVADPGVL